MMTMTDEEFTVQSVRRKFATATDDTLTTAIKILKEMLLRRKQERATTKYLKSHPEAKAPR